MRTVGDENRRQGQENSRRGQKIGCQSHFSERNEQKCTDGGGVISGHSCSKSGSEGLFSVRSREIMENHEKQ